jgi:hypothetical protein
MLNRSESRIGDACAIAGGVLLFTGTYLHPMGADPNDAIAAVTEYAADHLLGECPTTEGGPRSWWRERYPTTLTSDLERQGLQVLADEGQDSRAPVRA